MAKGQDIKRRIRSIDKTRQITRTMELVATSKLKKATDRVRAARPFAERLREVVERLVDPEMRERYPLLRQPESARRAAVLLLTSNRGLAGAFNVNLIREARMLIEALEADGVDVDLHVVGKKGIAYFRFRGKELASQRTDITDRPGPEDSASLIDPLVERFRDAKLDAVWVVYAQFRSALSTPPARKRILPVPAAATSPAGEGGGSPPPAPADGSPAGGALDEARDRKWRPNFLLSPSADEIVNRILPLYLRSLVYGALVETAAAEQGARRTAMKNATDNAGDMLERLQRRYNRARQAQITQEIAEIVGGAAALE